MIESETCTLDEKTHALNRALSSRVFSRSEQLKAFLRYICEADAVRPGLPLNEYVIGVEVLRRPEGYSPAEDSSVRTRAYELRQKLEKLYSVELPDEEVQICIPKGTYTPQYLRRSLETSASSPLELSAVTEHSSLPELPLIKHRRFSPLLAVAVVLAAALCGSLFTWLALRHSARTPATEPVLAEAWGPLAQAQSTALVTVATPLSLVVGPFAHEVFGSQNYPAPPETYPAFRTHRLLPSEARLGLTFSDNMLAVGTMNAALTCANTLRGFGTSFQLLPDRVASVSALRGRNAILLGASIDSETIAVSMQEMPLGVEFSPDFHEFVIRDRISGKVWPPKEDASGDLAEVFGLITVKDSRDDGSRNRLLLFSGITSVGVQGAAEFFSSASALRSFQTRLGRKGPGRFPPAYQIVVRCRCNKLSLLSFDYFMHRIVTAE